MHALETDDRESVPDSCVYIVDGNAMLHSMVNLPLTFGLLALTLLSYLPKSATVHFVTDPYHKDSIKVRKTAVWLGTCILDWRAINKAASQFRCFPPEQ